MNTEFEPLPLKFTWSGDSLGSHAAVTLEQIKRNDRAALYGRTAKNGHPHGFEVFRIVRRPATVLHGRTITAREVYPSASQFGRTAWYCVEMDRAMKRFEAITAEAEAKATKSAEVEPEPKLCEIATA